MIRPMNFLALLVIILTTGCLSFSQIAKSPTSTVDKSPQSINLTLQSLQSDCHVERRWIGLSPILRSGVFLICSGTPFLVVHPWNLMGHVTIANTQQALEYVRIFSSFGTYDSFQMNGMLEVRPEDAEWLSDLAMSPQVSPGFHLPEVLEIPSEGLGNKKSFQVRRIVVTYDQEVKEVVEVVREDGFYAMISGKVLLPDIRELGFIHQIP